MNSAKVRIFRLDLEPVRELPVARHKLKSREILRLEVETQGGAEFRSVDVSPLPHFHSETLLDCLEAAKLWAKDSSFKKLPVSLETALGFLNYEGPSRSGEFQNTALLSLEGYEPYQITSDLKVCKVKTGRLSLDAISKRLSDLLALNPNLRFRVDFNQAHLKDDLVKVRELIRLFPIDYLEEPSDDIRALKELARSVPIALDENLGRDEELDRMAKAWVIKPNRLGFHETKSRLLDRSPVLKVLSNVFESDQTLMLYAHAYASWVDHPEALGFGTAFYFEDSNSEWNPRRLSGSWPTRPFPLSSRSHSHEGKLLWEN